MYRLSMSSAKAVRTRRNRSSQFPLPSSARTSITNSSSGKVLILIALRVRQSFVSLMMSEWRRDPDGQL